MLKHNKRNSVHAMTKITRRVTSRHAQRNSICEAELEEVSGHERTSDGQVLIPSAHRKRLAPRATKTQTRRAA